MNRMMNGAALRGGGPMAMPASGQPTGRDLARPPGPPADEGGGDLGQAISTVIEAAKSVGFNLPAGEVPPEQLPQVYQQLLAAAARSNFGATDEGIAIIEHLARSLGIQSPFEQQQEGAPDSALSEGQPLQGGLGQMPGGGMLPPQPGPRRY